MCLLIAGKSNAIRATLLHTAGLLADIFDSNADGVGAMYASSKFGLRRPKVLPKTLDQCRAFIAALPTDDRNLALHFRMRTHGNIDKENCHPYDVLPGDVALMHNGVLHQGNRADTTKSDTWHYINDVVRPMLADAPRMFLNEAWQRLVAEDITNSNRFAIMNSDGELVILNRDTGIEHDGIWFSNTYAWTPGLLIPGYKKKQSFAGWNGWGGSSFRRMWDYEDDERYGLPQAGVGTTFALGSNIVEGDDGDIDETTLADDVADAAWRSDHEAVKDILSEAPDLIIPVLMAEYDFVSVGADTSVSTTMLEALERGDDNDVALVVKAFERFPDEIVQVMVHEGQWFAKAINDKPEPVEVPA